MSLGLYLVAVALLLGYDSSVGNTVGRTVQGFAWGGLVGTWWGRGLVALFLCFLATLVFLATLKSGAAKRSNK
jgi:hypothetical protein